MVVVTYKDHRRESEDNLTATSCDIPNCSYPAHQVVKKAGPVAVSGVRSIRWSHLVAALRDDGYSKATGAMIRGNGKIDSACAWGQIGLNLGVSPDEAYNAATRFKITLPNGKQTNVGSFIMKENDDTGKTLQQIAIDLEQPDVKVAGGRRRVKFSAPRRDFTVYSNYRGVTVPESDGA